MKNCTLPKIYTLLSFLVLLSTTQVFAQPANDDCSGAIDLSIGAGELSCIPLDGTTLDATQSTAPVDVCSGTWFADDVWYSFTTPDVIFERGYVVKASFGDAATDVPSVGMAIYAGCGGDQPAIFCSSTADPFQNKAYIYSCDLTPNTTYYVRVWSTPETNVNSGTFSICAYQNTEDNLLWGGNPGEGDFDGGLNGWTIVNDALCSDTFDLWRWKEIPIANDGGFSANAEVLGSPTTCNGAMVFDSDFFDNGGEGLDNLGGGPCPGPQTGELISPAIDLSQYDVLGVSVKFFQGTRQFTSTYIVSYSNDGGTTWIDREVNDQYPVNSAHVQEFVRVSLPEADLTSTDFRIKFRYEANYYYWVIDDVQLVETEFNNLKVMENWYAIAPNAMTPASQVEGIPFLADVANVGSVAQPNSVLNMSVTNDNTNTEVFNADLSYGTMAADSVYENAPFNETFTPSGDAGTSYTATYSISSDSSDFDLGDNNISFSFMLTDTLFAKETGRTRNIVPAPGNWTGSEPYSWAYGNCYYVTDATGLNARYASFGLGDAADYAGRLINLTLYKWEDTNTDTNVDPDERQAIAGAFYEIQGTEANEEIINIRLNILPQNQPGPIPLEDNTYYVMMLEYFTADQTAIELAASDAYDYGAMIFTTDSLEMRRYGSMLGVAGDLNTEPYSSLGFGWNFVPVVRLSVGEALEAPVNTDEVLAEENIVKITPNPASDYINLTIELVEAQSEVQVQLLDVTGKIIYNQTYDNVQNEQFTINVSDYAPGNYLLNFITKKGNRTERLIIQR